MYREIKGKSKSKRKMGEIESPTAKHRVSK
jgi:hypothetical protein